MKSVFFGVYLIICFNVSMDNDLKNGDVEFIVYVDKLYLYFCGIVE